LVTPKRGLAFSAWRVSLPDWSRFVRWYAGRPRAPDRGRWRWGRLGLQDRCPWIARGGACGM